MASADSFATYAQAAVVLGICAFVYYKRTKNQRSALTPANVPANPANPAKASLNPPPPPADQAVKEEEEEVVVVKGQVYSPA